MKEIEVWRGYAQALEEANQAAQSRLQGKGVGGVIAAGAANVAHRAIHLQDYRRKK